MSSGTALAPVPADEPPDYPPGLIPPSRRRRSQGMLGDVIVELGFARREVVDAAVLLSREQGRMTGQLLIEAGELREDQLARALAERLGVDFVDLSVFEIDPQALKLIDGDVAKRYHAVPVGFLADGRVVLAMSDPTNVLTVDEMSMLTGHRMNPACAARADLDALMARYNRLEEPAPELLHERAKQEPVNVDLGTGPDADAPTVKLVHQIVARAIELEASDIHFDPSADDMKVLMRIDGVITPATTVPRSMAASVVARVKIMAGLDISERRRPQDGRAQFTVDGRVVDIRVVTLPLVGGEGVVMRILDAGTVVRDLEALGMQAAERERFLSSLRRNYGAVLVTGPTGSGKSTTLYSGLSAIHHGERSILTIEDPVEAPIAGIKQMQVSPKTGVTFATGLRSILRADPDVIMVGEIRDRETAEIAVQSALTGHLMLSTLHTHDAASAVTRLIDMGIEPFMLAAAIDCVVAQRLARRLCTHCKRSAKLTDGVLAEHGLAGAEVFDAVGCMRCGETGYSGRIGLFQVMSMNEELRRLVIERGGVDDITEAAICAGMRTIHDDGIDKVRQGITSLAELGRVTSRA